MDVLREQGEVERTKVIEEKTMSLNPESSKGAADAAAILRTAPAAEGFNSNDGTKAIFRQSLTKRDKLLPIGALVLGALFVWLFYERYPGISVPIFVTAFYAILFTYVRPSPVSKNWFGWFLSIPVFLLSLTFLLFRNDVFMILNLLMLLVLVLLQTLLITGLNSFKWDSPGILIDLLFGMFYRCLAHVLKPFEITGLLLKKKTSENRKKTVGARVLTGLLISAPLLAILLALLSSADMVFGELIDWLPELFEDLNIGEVVGRVITAFVIFIISFSYLWSLGHGDRPADSALRGIAAEAPLQRERWDIVTVITITASINIIYLIFVVIQFAYLFGGSGLPEGFTYAEYARRGFFELILVTLLNIGFLACTLTFTGRGSAAAGAAFKALNTIMICCTFVMLISAFYRMALYERAYGYTFLRIVTQAFMIFLLALFVATLARVWFERLPLLRSYIIIAIIAFTAVNFINVDGLIARKNIERYYSTNKIDVLYFRTLSNAVVGDLMRLEEDGEPFIALAAREQLNQRRARLSSDWHWQSFNLTDFTARQVLMK